MAQNISLWGANYSAVPSVLLPKQGGGTASFVDVTSTTATASDVASGKLFYTALGVLTTGTASGGGGTGLVYETGTYTPTADIARPTINFASTHATVPVFVGLEDVDSTVPAQSSNQVFMYFNAQRFSGYGYRYNSQSTRAGLAAYAYMGSANSAGGTVLVRYPDTNATDTSTSYTRYWVTESGFSPYSNSTGRYWRSGRTYKWIAVWM